jgi:phage tail-like protein
MSAVPVVPARVDPYKSFNFRVQWDHVYILGISRVTGLVRTSAIVEQPTPGNLLGPGIWTSATQFQPITLERGLTQDTAFEDWANLVWNYGQANGGSMALGNFRKDVNIELCNDAGQMVQTYTVYGCWPSEYGALPDLDACGNVVAIEHLKLENEGWERNGGAIPIQIPGAL